MFTKIATTGVLATALLLTAAGAAYADPTPSPSKDPGARVTRSCKLAGDLQPAVDDQLAKINGGADVPGSVTWVQAKAAKARAAGHTKAADALDEHAVVRTGRGTVLTARKTQLAQLVTWCSAHGYATAK